MSFIYLDHNATTPLRAEVLKAMTPYLEAFSANPSSLHSPGQAARISVDRARQRILALAGARTGDVVFTGSGTEAVHLGVVGAVTAAARTGHVVVSAIEHAAGMDAARMLEDRGYAVTRVRPDSSGAVQADDLRRAFRDDTVLVSVLHGGNETGVIQPVAAIAGICREHGVLFHTDAVQSVGKIPVQADTWGADLISLAAHKMGGPPGVGALWRRDGVSVNPLIPGTQEGGVRGGTLNTASIVGFGTAAELCDEAKSGLEELRDHLESRIQERLPMATVTGKKANRLPNTTHLTFPSRVGKDLVLALDLEGFGVSSGSACSSGSEKPSHVLLAMGMPEDQARTAVRVSLGRNNTRAEVDAFVETLATLVGSRLEVGAET